MKKCILKSLMVMALVGFFAGTVSAQKKPARNVKKRPATTKSTKNKTKTKVSGGGSVTDQAVVAPSVEAPKKDSLPIPMVKPSLRPDEAVETSTLRDRTPLPYEHLRADDALYRHKIWREIDTREKINQAFRYSADENNGNQRFISILFKAIQDSVVTVFDAIDDRFTSPLTIGEVSRKIAGDSVPVETFDAKGQSLGVTYKLNEVNLDSAFTKFQIKEEVIFDKESSRLFWRILGIAPLKKLVTASGMDYGDVPIFWVYYPDMRPVFSKYEVYNGKNFGGRMSWEELFESRMFYGRIIKSSIDNPYDQFIKNVPGLSDKPILQLLEGENIKEKIFNYEQDLWSY
jgi:gliding motility associated protien GldN